MADDKQQSGFQHFLSVFGGGLLSEASYETLKAIVKAFTEESAAPWRRRAGAMVLGTPSSDEQMFSTMLELAERKEWSTPEVLDSYLIWLADKLPREKQNVYRINTVQSWLTEMKHKGFENIKPEDVMEISARVIANHANRLQRNEKAFEAFVKLQDLDLPLQTRDWKAENEKMRREIAELDDEAKGFWNRMTPGFLRKLVS